ncbi:uncharacterized protein LOC121976180 [Zingiber officinale]|uniref:Uncharacterized protein n=1 Tax=Zingiber officinale TaxID=94328 RepID=A0A8J5GSE7_ZINOF|nr:uncharacterized protein LOC121976180 [Zingiber officinale]KAG6511882.1 hypothetical protein ZIOFF_029961 [Zingiber officinale]
MATATATTLAIPRVSSQRFRAPPPSPVATGNGRRSAAVDDRVFSEFLDVSLRVPDLSLPQSFFSMKSVIKVPPEIDLCSMVSGDESSARCVLSAASEVGAIRVVGGGKALAEEVRAAIEAGKVILKPEGERPNTDVENRRFARRDGVVQEFVWYRLRSPETERLLQRTWPESYPALRDKMESVASRLDTVAECIAKILSKYVTNQTPSKRLSKVQSTLHLRKQDSPYSRNTTMDYIDATSLYPEALSLHICGDHHEFCVRHPEGSIITMLRAGDILVTIGKTLQEWCNGELKSVSAEALYQPVDDSFTSFSLEYMCSPLVLSHELDHETKTISLTDQLLAVLFLVFLYNLCFCFSS